MDFWLKQHSSGGGGCDSVYGRCPAMPSPFLCEAAVRRSRQKRSAAGPLASKFIMRMQKCTCRKRRAGLQCSAWVCVCLAVSSQYAHERTVNRLNAAHDNFFPSVSMAVCPSDAHHSISRASKLLCSAVAALLVAHRSAQSDATSSRTR